MVPKTSIGNNNAYIIRDKRHVSSLDWLYHKIYSSIIHIFKVVYQFIKGLSSSINNDPLIYLPNSAT